MAATPGTQANKTGTTFEYKIAGLFNNLEMRAEADFRSDITGLDGRSVNLSVYVRPCISFPKGLAVLAMNQQGPGSGVYKIQRDLWNICACFPIPAIMILEGDNRDMNPTRAFAKSIVGLNWLNPDAFPKKQFSAYRVDCQRLLGVFTYPEFESWLRRVAQTKQVVTQPVRDIPSAPVTRISQIDLLDGHW